jgi:hypothetical protein
VGSLKKENEENNVEQPPPAVPVKPNAAPKAKPAKFEYRRFLPHFQGDDQALMVTLSVWPK